MILMPISHPSRPDSVDLLIILEEKNVARMREGDPANFEPIAAGHELGTKPIRFIAIAYEQPDKIEQLKALAAAGNLRAILDIVNRGFAHRPEEGDCLPPENLNKRTH